MTPKKVAFTEQKIKIPTYPEAKRENLPMFAENRVHQRTSGNPYPNKVVLEAQREIKIDKEYTVLKLENEFIELAVLPELGGKIWYAKDKKTGYDFIYKNNVVKPALIGVLGSWTSGGMEFNWPFHHRASTFMPVDYEIEYEKNGVTIWISEHDPIDRMKGTVGISLKENECIFETKVKLDNLTDTRKSFLWWENTAVPVNEQYEIFFPEDVNYVRFHYKRSVTTYPIANNDRFGAFNGIYYNGNTDISKHKNTKPATSYFSAESEYDYFGGYDHGKESGIVHIADHHISPGKKMFTWAYCQLSKTWENALTDTDGAYAELMAGCYSDNQPDFSWLMPNETKTFTQKWYPIHGCGAPTYANENLALFNRENLTVQAVKNFADAMITVKDVNGKEILRKKIDLICYETVTVNEKPLEKGDTVEIRANGAVIGEYTFGKEYRREIPEPRKEFPYFKKIKSAQELYKLGVHVEQYRAPEYRAEDFYKEALKRDEKFTPAMVALAEDLYKRFLFDEAREYIDRAEKIACEYNTSLESGRLYYVKALLLSASGEEKAAYDYYYKAFFSYDYKSAASLKLSFSDIRNKNYDLAEEHLKEALNGNGKSTLANAYFAYLPALKGDTAAALRALDGVFKTDRLNLFAFAFRAILTGDYKAFSDKIHTDISQNLLDICERLYECKLTAEIVSLLEGVKKYRSLSALPLYLLDALKGISTEHTDEGIAFPSRGYESEILRKISEKNPADFTARYLLGCLYYGRGNYEKGVSCFEKALAVKEDYRVLRNLAAANYSHSGNRALAEKYMKKAMKVASPSEKQMTFEYAYFLAKTGAPPQEIADFILKRNTPRDEISVELARAYNHMNEPDKALETLLQRKFVACEGGEHYIADQYMYAHYLKGRAAYEQGDYADAVKEFEQACILPQSLGSGLWNDVKKVPYLYFRAMAYDKLGRREEAEKILKSFLHYRFDYFTNMYLYTFRYYAARAYEYLGEKEKADRLILEGIESDLLQLNRTDPGYFSTTPFFISYMDAPKKERRTYFAYRLYLYCFYTGDKKNAEKFRRIYGKDRYGMYITDFTK